MQRYPYHRSGVTARALDMVTEREVEALGDVLDRGRVPADLVAKLGRLRTDDPRELYLKQQSLILGWLLTSPGAWEVCRVGSREGERLLRMLAYVRKDEDAIPDTWLGGMADDHDLMRVTCTEFREILERFKAWHLSRRVPVLWHGTPARLWCALPAQECNHA